MMMEARPPLISFGYEEVEDREASIEKGYYVPKQVAFVYVTPAGSKDVIPRNAEEWLLVKRQEAAQQSIPPEWLRHFETAFENWKKNEEIPEFGVPIKTWMMLSPAERAACLNANVRTVEDLAQLNEQGGQMVGMGWRTLREKAENWLKAANDQGKVAQEVTALKAELADTRQLLEEAVNTIRELKAEAGEKRRGRPPKDLQEAA